MPIIYRKELMNYVYNIQATLELAATILAVPLFAYFYFCQAKQIRQKLLCQVYKFCSNWWSCKWDIWEGSVAEL